jgi:hypothetical protein
MKLLTFYVIYRGVMDRPGPYTVRTQVVEKGNPEPVPGDDARDFDSLDAARSVIPPGLVNLGREEDDDRVIVEVWV